MEDGWFVIVNPTAGGRKAEKAWHITRNYLESIEQSFAFELTNKVMDGADIAQRAISMGYRKLFVIGGDGSLNEVVNGIFAQTKVPTAEILVGMVSVGTGNDFIKTVGIPKAINDAIKLLKLGKAIILDAGIAYYYLNNERKHRYFINVAGMAFDAEVTRYANEHKTVHFGKAQYTWSLIRSLFAYKSTQVKLTVDNDVYQNTSFCLNVGNCRYAGGGMMIVPEAIPNDGLFHVTFVKDVSKWDVVMNIAKLFNGTFLGHPKISTHTGKRIKVESTPPIFLEVEGESLGHSPFEFEILPSSIQVLVP